MKKVIMTAAAIVAASMEQVFRPGFQPLAEQQQQAKAGIVTPTDPATLADPNTQVLDVAKADPLRATAGATLVLGLRAKAGESGGMAVVTNALGGRSAQIWNDAASVETIRAAIAASTGMTKSAELTFDGGALNNAPMTNAVADGTGLATPINDALEPAKPSYSVQSIINKVEDIILGDGTKDAICVVNQDESKVYVYTGTPANIATARTAAVGAVEPNAEFAVDSTPSATSDNEFGE